MSQRDTVINIRVKSLTCSELIDNDHNSSQIELNHLLRAENDVKIANDGPVDHLSVVSLKRTHDGDPSEFGLPFKRHRTGIHTGSALINTMPDIFGRATLSQQRVLHETWLAPVKKQPNDPVHSHLANLLCNCITFFVQS